MTLTSSSVWQIIEKGQHHWSLEILSFFDVKIRCKQSNKHRKMSMRLYHRKSSASKDRLERLQVPNGIYLSNSLRLQNLSTCGYKDSLGMNRPRSQSLFPTGDHSLVIPSRSRSASFSGASKGPECMLTATEEEHIFQCYTRVMYILLGGLAAAALGLVLYGVHTFVKFQ